VNRYFSFLPAIFASVNIVLFVCLFSNSALATQNKEALNHNENARQLLQLAEYIGVDYSAAVSQGEVINTSEYAEMQQFANIIVDKSTLLQNPLLITDASALQQAVNIKASANIIQQHSQKIRKQLLLLSPALVLPSHLLTKQQTQTLFIDNCAACHGATGIGNGVLAQTLMPKPTDFSEQPRAMNRSLLGLYDAITNGLDGSAMDSFADLSEKQRWSLAFYVGGLAFKQPQHLTTQTNEPLAQISLQQWINSSPNTLRQQKALVNSAINLEQINTWRSQPELFFYQSNAPLKTTRVNLFAAVEAYKNNNLVQAQTLAVSAYLDGYELIENTLDAHNTVLRKAIESQLLQFRTLLSTPNQQTIVDSQLTNILQQLTIAEQMLTENGLSNNTIFSASMIILLREGLEALLIVIALITVMMRTNRRDGLKYIHLGWVSALIAGAFTWWAAENLISISGASRELMEGGAALLAAIVLFYVGYWMQGKTKAAQWQHYIRSHVDRHLNAGTLWGIAGLAFISVYREVFETVLFYQSLLAQSTTGQLNYLVAGLMVGIAILSLIAWLMIRYSVKLPITRFFSISAYFMLILAFILTGKGIAALQEAAIISLSPFPVHFSISWLGITATWQGILAQALVIILSALLMYKRNNQQTA